jgi:hypothetical protein
MIVRVGSLNQDFFRLKDEQAGLGRSDFKPHIEADFKT